MIDRFIRPSVEEINDVYTRLFKSTLTLSKLKDAAIGGRLFKPSDDPIGVVGRSMIWRHLLCENEPSKPPAQDTPSLSLKFWQDSRKTYVDALLDKMQAPDGSYHEGLIIPGVESLPKPNQTPVKNLDKNNPLSLDTENPWTTWFASVDLRKTILQDVERTFPDVGYFRDPEVQLDLTNILFIFSLQNPVLGYRQGMHELLALLYYACDFDSISEEQAARLKSHELGDLLSRAWVTADAYTLFLAVMRGVGHWYEWREPPASLQKGPPYPNPGPVEIQPYVAPIVEACNRIQSIYLKSVDPDLWKHLQASGIEAQIYGIRWLRLLFTREFGVSDALLLWDGLFACDPTLELAKWICVAMLIRIRNQLIPSDYSTQLTFLLRYPPLPIHNFSNSTTNEQSFATHHIALLLRQALSLQIAPTVTTGASVVYENRNLLSIASEVPEPPPPPMKRRTEQGRIPAINDGPLRMLQRPMHARYGSSGSLGFPDIARNILDRGESLGINRTVMNAVSEIKRNLPDLSASFNASQYQPASFQLLDGKPAEQRQPWETRSRFEVEKEMVELKKLQKKIGDSLEWILETLSQEDEGEPAVLRKQQALGSLAYAKDILKGSVSAVDDSRLFDERALNMRTDAQESIPATAQGLPHVFGYPPLPNSSPTTRVEAQGMVTSQSNNPERRHGLGHSSSSPSLNDPSARLSPALPRTPWTPVHDKPASIYSPVEAIPPKPQQRSASSSSRPIQTETSAKPPIQYDPLGVL
ncbi:RabGAP/TBC [Thelephora ganbajun]|uniref:RabGAP/TBC n=1 Tax=Thelephora ganbajun TaxID=370292 RepID=A0ACB6ZN40_THEGA|nr:RabGAP/TBC [Thelephora ganbajun]